jgi:multisubunit Na+/H+ antiporter MnhG subunit
MSGGLWDQVQLWAGLALVVVGLGLMARAVLTLQAGGDVYRRLHGVVVGQGWAAAAVAAGLALTFASPAALLGLGLLALGLALAIPVLAHAAANAAHAEGAEPAAAPKRSAP